MNPSKIGIQLTYSEKIASGAYATVYKETIGGVALAIKVDSDMVDAYYDEVEILGKLKHPAIIPMISSFVDARGGHIIMPLADSTLYEYIGGVDHPTSLKYLAHLLSGLEYIHSHRIVHCDIKPDNILMYRGLPGIADFGISEDISECLIESTFCSPDYRPPEAWLRLNGYDTSVDIWALGVVYYQLVKGNLPFPLVRDEDNAGRILMNITSKIVMSRSDNPLNTWVSLKDYEDMMHRHILMRNHVQTLLVNMMIQYNPENRFPAKQILSMLKEASKGTGSP